MFIKITPCLQACVQWILAAVLPHLPAKPIRSLSVALLVIRVVLQHSRWWNLLKMILTLKHIILSSKCSIRIVFRFVPFRCLQIVKTFKLTTFLSTVVWKHSAKSQRCKTRTPSVRGHGWLNVVWLLQRGRILLKIPIKTPTSTSEPGWH